MNKKEILEKITKHYIGSHDFNGIIITDLDSDHERLQNALRELLTAGNIVLNFGDRHPNPYILAFEPEPIAEQLAKLDALTFEPPKYEMYGPLKMQINSINCCAYPSKKQLRKAVNPAMYKGKPYTLMLALGEPQLSYRAFNLRILEFYRNDPRYSYQTDDIHGHISARHKSGLKAADDTFLETFGFAFSKDIKKRYVAVFVRYLANLTPTHQQRWKLEEIKGKTILHPDYARATAGEWPEKDSIFNAFCEELSLINKMTKNITGVPLFLRDYDRASKPTELGFLIRPTKKGYEEFVHLMDKMLSDNLNKRFFEGKLELVTHEKKGGVVIERQKGTLVLLDEWLTLNVKFPDPEPKDEMIKVFKNIRKARGPLAHVVGTDEWNDQYFGMQRDLIMQAYGALRTLRLIFANHHLARSVEVPEWLQHGDIRTF
jgi:hypothetical protein